MRDLDPNDLRALREQGPRETPGGTLEDRKRLERRARLVIDARRDRPVTPTVQVNFAMSPEDKGRMVRLCKLHDIKIVDFMREAVGAAIEKLEGK